MTLVDNLETFGIDPSVFSHEVQVNVACSGSVVELPGKTKATQVVVQGNQTKYIITLLTGMYSGPDWDQKAHLANITRAHSWA